MSKTFDLITVTASSFDEVARQSFSKINEILVGLGFTRCDDNGEHLSISSGDNKFKMFQSYSFPNTNAYYLTIGVYSGYASIYWGITSVPGVDDNTTYMPVDLSNSVTLSRTISESTQTCTFGISVINNDNAKMFKLSKTDCLPDLGLINVNGTMEGIISKGTYFEIFGQEVYVAKGSFLSTVTFADLNKDIIVSPVYCATDTNSDNFKYHKKIVGMIECPMGNIIDGNTYLIGGVSYMAYKSYGILIEA